MKKLILQVTPQRTLPVFFADANDGIGVSKVDGAWCRVPSDEFGPAVIRERRRGGAGEHFRQLLDEEFTAAPSTHK